MPANAMTPSRSAAPPLKRSSARYPVALKLRAAVIGAGPIPRGWARIVRELDAKLTMLAATALTHFNDVLVTGRLGGHGRQQFAVQYGDRVLQGVLRKANAQALASCRLCGRGTFQPPGATTRSAYCAPHAAADWLLGLVTPDTNPANAHRRSLFAEAVPERDLRIPRALVELWLQHDRSPTATVARDAVPDGSRVVTLDSFDAAAFAAWITPLVPRLKQMQREREERERQPR